MRYRAPHVNNLTGKKNKRIFITATMRQVKRKTHTINSNGSSSRDEVIPL